MFKCHNNSPICSLSPKWLLIRVVLIILISSMLVTAALYNVNTSDKVDISECNSVSPTSKVSKHLYALNDNVNIKVPVNNEPLFNFTHNAKLRDSDAIIIKSNEDFIKYGFHGNGTINNPFVIQN